MNAARRAWYVYADPSGSRAAGELKVLIPLAIAGCAISLAFPEMMPYIGVRAIDIVLLYAILWVVRQRDEARTQLAAQAS